MQTLRAHRTLHIRSLARCIKLHVNVVCPIILFLSSLAMLHRIGWNLIAVWDSVLPPFDPRLSMEMDLTMWDSHTLGGRVSASPTQSLYHAAIYLLRFAFPVGVANTILSWLLFLMCGISMYVFVIRTLKTDTKGRPIIALISSLAYMFNPYWVFQFDTSFLNLFTLAFLPLLMLMSRAALISATTSARKTITYSMLASLVTVLMMPGVGIFEEGLVTAFFLGAYLTFLSIQMRKLRPLILTSTLIVTFSLLANLWWIAPHFVPGSVVSALNRSSDYLSYIIGGLTDRRPSMGYFNVLRGMSYYVYQNPYIPPPQSEIYRSPFFIAISLLRTLIVLIPLLSRRVAKVSESLVFAVIAVIFIPLFLTGLNSPFGLLILWLIYSVPVYIFSRSSALMFILEYVYAYMFSLGILFIHGFLNKVNRTKLVNYSIIGILLLLCVGVLPFPEWFGHSAQVYVLDNEGERRPLSIQVQVPCYVRNVIDYLNHSPNEGGVLVLPKGSTVRAYDWHHGYFGFDVYYLSLNRPVLTHYNVGAIQDDIYDLITDYMKLSYSERPARELSHGEGAEFARLLTLVGAKYIVVAEDALGWGDSFRFNIEDIHRFLSNCIGIRLVNRFGKHVLYETIENPKTLYTATRSMLLDDIHLKGSESSLEAIKQLLGYKDPTKVVFVNNQKDVVSYGIDPPTIISKRFGSSEFHIEILATTPFILASNILYHDGWVAEIGGTQLEHLKVNGVFNGWIVEKTGSSSITIRYRPQEDFQFLLRLSLVFVTAECATVLLLSWTSLGTPGTSLVTKCKSLNRKAEKGGRSL